MKERWKMWYRKQSLRKKALTLYLVWSLALSLAVSACMSIALYDYLKKRETETMAHTLDQAVQQMESQITLYSSLSDYIFNNTDLAAVLGEIYEENYYEMYQALEDTILPAVKNYQLLNPNISSIVIYTDSGLPSYKKYVYPLAELTEKEWFPLVEDQYGTVWLTEETDGGAKLLLVRRMLHNLTYTLTNYLCITVDYEAFFLPFRAMLTEETGIVVERGEGERFFVEEMGLEEAADGSGAADTDSAGTLWRGADYLTCSSTLSNGWEVTFSYSMSAFRRETFPAITMLWGIAILLALLLFLCTYFLSGTLIRPVEELTQKVKAVADASSHDPISTNRTDEIGILTQNFNHLIQDVYISQMQAREYQIKALYAQINPHFLYNALGIINNKAIMAEQDDISHMTLLLAQFYRTCLNHGKDITSIRNEITNIQMYIEIQKMIYTDHFQVCYDLDETLLEIRMPNFILQPIVENAIEHGLRNVKKPMKKLEISLVRTGDDAVFHIRDNGCGMAPEEIEYVKSKSNEGIGLSNIDARLRLCFGNTYGLRIESVKGEWTEVSLGIPLDSAL
ncbi:MAG: histidine kinase [Eubacteriales bacterium]|nr:histidine kinase [Eubacteriales bacterium]